jgi:hypothetical protein
MPIPLPNLDDLSYADLTAQARASIPSLYPTWTNHNPSDPGITLVELFAWLTEMLLFQVNEVPPANTERFLQLLNGPTWTRPPDMNLDEAVRQTVLQLRERYRAVTAEDYEWLTLHAWPQSEAAAKLPEGGVVRRVRCLPRRNLSAADPAVRRAPAPAHVSVVVVPEPAAAAERQRQRLPIRLPLPLFSQPSEEAPLPTDELLAALSTFLDGRRTLTTRHHVVGPDYLRVDVSADLALREDAPPAEAIRLSRRALVAFFHALTGGPDRAGWPFGRPVYVSEIYAELEKVPLVSYVENVQVSAPAGDERLLTDEADRVVGVELEANELVRLGSTTLTAYDSLGAYR